MLTYYIDFRTTANGQFELHHGSCRDLPDRKFLIYLGRHDSGADALTFGRTIFANLHACRLCCPECNLLNWGSAYATAEPGLPLADEIIH